MLETILQSFIGKLSNNLLLVLLSGLTITTSGVAGAKIFTRYTSAQDLTPIEVEGVSEKISAEIEIPSSTDIEEAEEIEVLASTDSSSQNQIQFPSAVVEPSTNTDNAEIINSNTQTKASCIITVFGKNYDVQSLKSSHPGGDVFVCDTDMSATYQSAHGTNVGMLSKYLTTATIGSSNSQSPITGKVSSFKHEEEREDEEYEEEQENYYEDHKDHEDDEHEEDHKDHEDDEHENHED